MNPFDSNENILIDGMVVRLPVIVGEFAPLSTSITFRRPCWVPDEEVRFCLSCNAKFSQFRRKHHCRNCGKIYCDRCCFEKISLPHFGIREPDRVCNKCKLIVELILKAKSDDLAEKHDAVLGLSTLLQNSAGLAKMIECGGIHVMLSISVDADSTIKSVAASALHSVTRNMMLNSFLVEAGCLKVLKNFLVSACGSVELLSDTLSTLNLLCMDANVRIQALKEGIIDSLLGILSATGTMAAFASRILTLLVCNFEYLEFILQNHKNIIADLFNVLQNEDYQMQMSISKILVYFSAGSATFREMIIKEDVSRGYILPFLLKGANPTILNNVVCIISNISLSVHDNFAHYYITGLCELLHYVDEDKSDLLVQLGRGLANFSESPSNALHLTHHLTIIVERLLKYNLEPLQVHACRLLVQLLSSEMPSVLDKLSQSGLEEFIQTIFDLPGITEILNNLLLRKVSKLSVSK